MFFSGSFYNIRIFDLCSKGSFRDPENNRLPYLGDEMDKKPI